MCQLSGKRIYVRMNARSGARQWWAFWGLCGVCGEVETDIHMYIQCRV